MPKTLFAELCEACNMEVQDGETLEDFSKRATKKINGLPDAKWKALSNGLQVWANKTLEAFDDIAAGKPDIEMPALKGFPEEAEATDDADGSEDAGQEVSEEVSDPTDD